MKKTNKTEPEPGEPGEPAKLVEGLDYYFENGLMVLTARFLRARGYCCDNGCRHCPYPKNAPPAGQSK